MSLVLDSSSTITQNIHQAYAQCLNSLKDLIVQLTYPPHDDLRHDERSLPRALETYGRLRTWGEESRAALPVGSRESLDQILRQEDKLRNAFVKTLGKIHRQALSAYGSLRAIGSDFSKSLHEQEHGSGADSDFENNSDDDDGDQEHKDGGKPDMILIILQQINADMNLLAQMSVLMKRPGFNRKYIHSTGTAELHHKVAMYTQYDLLHVEEKFLHWQTRGFRCHVNEEVATLDRLARRALLDSAPRGRHVLLMRLSMANTRRREQLHYWSKHPDQILTTTGGKSHVTGTTLEAGGTRHEERNQAITGATQKPTDGSGTEIHAPESAMSRNTYSTVAASAVPGLLHATNPEGTIYAESTVGTRRSNRVPDVPRSSRKDITFECPYCHLEIDSLTMHNRQHWKRHIFRDLRPYMCTFEHCQSSDKQYSTRRDWKYHEFQTHRRQWICKQHDIISLCREDFSAHILEQHMASIRQDQLPVLVEMSERTMDDMTIVRCPLCPDERRLMTLHNHIAEHLEEISLFVLPINIEDDNQDGDNSEQGADGDFSSRMEEYGLSISSTDNATGDLSRNHYIPYRKVAVKIIRWDESLDDLQGHTKEIDRLQSLFQNLGYECSVSLIRDSKRPQINLNKCVLDHVWTYDDPRSLMIFYYIGHASASKDHNGKANLKFSAGQNDEYTAYWHQAEYPILNGAHGDVITILDCYSASSAASRPKSATDNGSMTEHSPVASNLVSPEDSIEPKGQVDSPSYSLLASSLGDEFTHGSGPASFTAVLCDALEELVAELDGGPFPLTQLCDRINRNTKNAGSSVLWTRTPASWRQPQLGRVRFAESFREGPPQPLRPLFDQVVMEIMYILKVRDIFRSRMRISGAQERDKML